MVIHFKYSSVYMLIPKSLTISFPTFFPSSQHVFSLHLLVCYCFVNKFICITSFQIPHTRNVIRYPYVTPSYITYHLRTPGNEILDTPIQIIIILTATHKTTHTHTHKYKKPIHSQLPWSSKIRKIKTTRQFFSLSGLSKKN